MNNMRFMYIRDNKYQPIGCLAITINRKKNRAEYGISMRNPKDAMDDYGKRVRFDKDLAKQMALINLDFVSDSECKRAYIPENANMHQITASVMKDIVARGLAPSGAVKFAKGWLSSVEFYIDLKDRYVLP